MRVFVAAIVILLLPVCYTETKSCGENAKVLSEFYNLKNSSYGFFHTPKFPGAFETPFTYRWIINASSWQGLFTINIYLTQMYIAENRNLKIYHGNNDPCVYPKRDNPQLKLKNKTLQSFTFIPSNKPFMEVELTINSLYNTHFRTDYFMHEYGFNITYEIVPGNISRNDSCSLKKCSYAGNCYIDKFYKKFFCDCLNGHSGPNCEIGPQCNPEKGINHCRNGGKCSSLGGLAMSCICKGTGYTGVKCEKEENPVIKECPGVHCGEVCSPINTSKPTHPCSCHNGSMIPPGWTTFEGVLKLVNPSLPIWDRRNSSQIPDQIRKMEQELSTRIRNAVNHTHDVVIMSVGEGSEFLFQFVGLPGVKSKIFEVFTTIVSKKELMSGYILGDRFTFEPSPALRMNSLLPDHNNKKEYIKVGKQLSLTCSATGSSRVQFSWFKNGAPINKSISTRFIDINSVPRDGEDQSRSVLFIAATSPFDSGTFTCKVSDMGEDKCMDINIDIILPPQIDVDPMSLTLLRNDTKIVKCMDNQYARSGNFTAKTSTFEWERKGVKIIKDSDDVVAEDLFPQGKLLRIIRGVESTVFTCGAINSAGEAKRNIQLEILDSRNSPSCRDQKEIIGDVKLQWKWSAPKLVAMEKCPANYVGYVQRACQLIGSRVQWGRTDFSKCLCKTLQKINTTLQNMKMGFAVLPNVDKIWELIDDYVFNKTILYAGEGEKIISVLRDASEYALVKGTAKLVFPNLYKIVSKFLQFPQSCVNENSLLVLNKLMKKMMLNYTHISTDRTNLFTSDVLVMESMIMIVPPLLSNEVTYVFPRKNKNYSYPKWLDIAAQVPLDNSTTLILIVFRNITESLSPTLQKFKTGDNTLHLVSSIVSLVVTNSEYFFSESAKIQLHFNVSKENILEAEKRQLNLTCGSLEPDWEDKKGFQWLTDSCILKAVVNNTVQCECDRLGQYAVFLLSTPKNKEEDINLPLNWSVITGCVVCIGGCAGALIVIWFHVQCKIDGRSVYTLKILGCLSLIMSILIILSLRNNESSIALSTCLCSLLITFLCCQLTKSLTILLSTERDIFPWLESVSLLTILGAVSFGSVLPVWTSAAILSHSRTADKTTLNISVLAEDSPVFVTFVATVAIIVLSFLVVYYKAVLRLRNKCAKLDQAKMDYKMKTLNRALLIILATLLTILSTILYGNIRTVEFYQYFFGLTTFSMGIIVFFAYTIKSEYPIPLLLMKKDLGSDKPDPERPTRQEFDRANSNRTLRKPLENGPVSSILLQPQSLETQFCSEAETTLDTFIDSSQATNSRQSSCRRTSVSSTKRSSIPSNKLPGSMTNPSNLGSSSVCSNEFSHLRCSTACKKNKSQRFQNSSRKFGLGEETCKPVRGTCLLRDEYVRPSTGSSGISIIRGNDSCPSTSKDCGVYVPPQPQYPPKSERIVPEFRTFHQQPCKVFIERDHPPRSEFNTDFPSQTNVTNSCLRNSKEERIIEGDTDSLELTGYEENLSKPTASMSGCEQVDKTATSVTELHYSTKSDSKKSPPRCVNKSDLESKIIKV